MKSKTTPAPWYAVNYSGFINIQSTPYYEATNIMDEDICKEAEANGNLAAKAPELLEALQDMVRLWEYAIVAFTILSEEKVYIKAKKVIEEAI